MEKKYKIGIGILAAAVIFMSAFSFVNSFGGKWVCIAENCDEWLYGDDWISANCRPDDVNGEQKLVCKMIVDEKEYAVPLDMINITNVKSCKQHSCVTQVLIRGK